MLAELVSGHRGDSRWWQWSRRREAAARAQAELPQRWAEIEATARHTQQVAQEQLDAHWRPHTTNEPDTVLAVLAASFEDNEAPVAPVGVDGAEVHLVVLVPSVDAVPSHAPSTTQAGNLSIRRMSATDRWALGHQLVRRTRPRLDPGSIRRRIVARAGVPGRVAR